MGVTPTGFVLKQYMSESDAINDTNALFVSQAVDGAITNFNQNDTDTSTTATVLHQTQISNKKTHRTRYIGQLETNIK